MRPILLAALVALTPLQDRATYSDNILNLAFSYPKSWSIQSRTKRSVVFRIPIENSTDAATLELVRSPFRSTADIWQTIQVDNAQIAKRTVVRQWTQQIFNASMLYTQTEYSQKGVDTMALTGLFYTQSPLKLLLNLTVPAGAYPNVQYELEQALESLHTIDGSTPKEDNPDQALPDADKKPEPVYPKHVLDDGKVKAKSVKSKQSVELSVSGRRYIVHLPDDWTAVDPKDGTVGLKSQDLATPLNVTLFSTLDSDPPQNALFKASSKTLGDFASVDQRDDQDPKKNKAGCEIGWVWRKGTSAQGPLMTFEGYGYMGDAYLLATYRITDPAAYANERRAIKALFDQISIEPAP